MISATVRRRIKKIVLWTEILLILVLGAGMGVVLGAVYQMNKLLPPESALDQYRAPVGTQIWSSDRVLLATLAAENRTPVALEQIPKHMQDAIIAIEDSRFYRHRGLDFRGLARALWANIQGGEMAQGGSTITQQLARNIFLSSRKNISRKIKEILLAVQIERNWTKHQILEAYLNQVYFGSGAYGIQSAAKTYFTKDVKNLTLEEAALLAGLVQRPSELSPYRAFKEEGNYDRTRSRRNMVIDRMQELGFVPADTAREAREAPVKVAKERPHTVGYFRAKYFVQHVVDQLRDALNYDQDIIDKAGLTVITTLNWKMQQQAEKVAREELAKIRKSHRVTEVALVCLDPSNGYIRAMVGGVNEPWEKYQFNCATQARRQPGSSFKAFVYAAAFENGRDPGSMVNGNVRPVRMPDGKWYRPKNHGRYGGSMSYTRAFAASVNGAAVNVCVEVGPRKVVEIAKRLGLKGPLRAYPSVALGTSEATPLEMATAYGVFAAKGKRAEPMAILQVRSHEGEILQDLRPRIAPTGLKPHTLASMDVLTRAVVTRGTGRAASVVPNAHGKTGTSENYTDAWFVGYTPDLVTAVWAGNRNNAPMARVYGGTIGAPIWSRFMQSAVALNPARKQKPAAELLASENPPPRRTRRPRPTSTPRIADGSDRNRIQVTVCAASGLLPGSACSQRATREYMLGDEPLIHCADTHGRSERARPQGEKSPAGTEGGAGDAPGRDPADGG